MAIDPNTVTPEDNEQSHEDIQLLKDYIPTTTDTSAQVRDNVKFFQFRSFLFSRFISSTL